MGRVITLARQVYTQRVSLFAPTHRLERSGATNNCVGRYLAPHAHPAAHRIQPVDRIEQQPAPRRIAPPPTPS